MKKLLAFCLLPLALLVTVTWAGEAADEPAAGSKDKATKADAKPAAKSKAAAKPYISPDGNLLPNGDFDSGKVTPLHWQTIDGLSSFWVKDADPKRGRVLKFDSDVLQSQAYNWWLKVDDGASPLKAPLKIPTKPPKFDTLAGLDGVWYWSHPIPIKKGKPYWLTLDVKGPEILVWLVGYPEKPSVSFGADAGAIQQYFAKRRGKAQPNKRNRKAFIHKYVWRGQLKAGGTNSWSTYSRRKKPFHPTKYTPKVKWVRVMLYPYWPPGEYFVDNVRLVEYDPNTHGQPTASR